MGRVLLRVAKWLANSAGGLVLVVVGVLLALPGVPGPGILLVFAGLALWANEFAWAERLRDRIVDRVRNQRERMPRWLGGSDGSSEQETARDAAPPGDDTDRLRPRRADAA